MGIGGIFRNSDGLIMYAFAMQIVAVDALDAKLQALHQGISEKVGLLNHNQSLGTTVESLLGLYDFGLDEINLR